MEDIFTGDASGGILGSVGSNAVSPVQAKPMDGKRKNRRFGAGMRAGGQKQRNAVHGARRPAPTKPLAQAKLSPLDVAKANQSDRLSTPRFPGRQGRVQSATKRTVAIMSSLSKKRNRQQYGKAKVVVEDVADLSDDSMAEQRTKPRKSQTHSPSRPTKNQRHAQGSLAQKVKHKNPHKSKHARQSLHDSETSDCDSEEHALKRREMSSSSDPIEAIFEKVERSEEASQDFECHEDDSEQQCSSKRRAKATPKQTEPGNYMGHFHQKCQSTKGRVNEKRLKQLANREVLVVDEGTRPRRVRRGHATKSRIGEKIQSPQEDRHHQDFQQDEVSPPSEKKRRTSGSSDCAPTHSFVTPRNQDPTFTDPIQESDSDDEVKQPKSFDTKRKRKPIEYSRKKNREGSCSERFKNIARKSILNLSKRNGVTRKPQRPPNKIEPGSSLVGLSAEHSQNTEPRARSNSPASSAGIGPRSDYSRSVKPKTRKSPRKDGKGSDDPIDLMSDDDDEKDNETIPEQSGADDKQPNTRARARSFREQVPRFAIGTLVFKEKPSVEFDEKGLLRLIDDKPMARVNSNTCFAEISFQGDAVDSLMEINYYLGPDASAAANKAKEEEQSSHPSFLALKVRPTTKNGLKPLKKWYKTGQSSENMSNSYIVIEFQSRAHLEQLINHMHASEALDPFLKNAELQQESAADYRKVLANEDEGEKRREERKARRARRIYGGPKETDAFVDKRPEDTVLLVYPFAGDKVAIEEAAKNLTEASGKNPSDGKEEESCEMAAEEEDAREPSAAPSPSSDEGAKPTATAATATEPAAPAKTEQRRHFLTIQVRDFERLCPGEFLNDSLVDFWMQWITRNMDPCDKNAIHCFSSHFFTTLADEGVGAVTKWTAKRGINVFDKKFVFIPINETIHWSLCVVVNAGHINQKDEDDEMACLLFLDSLKAHRKKKISKKVREWLNSEWKRIKDVEDAQEPDPFLDDKHFPLLNPKIPYQDNTWDCGVFVCRYAFAVLSIRHECFKRGEDWFRQDLTNCKPFKFDMEDIARLRKEMMTLIENLSRIYLPWKTEHDKQLKLEAREENMRKRIHQKKEIDEVVAGSPNASAPSEEKVSEARNDDGEQDSGKPEGDNPPQDRNGKKDATALSEKDKQVSDGEASQVGNCGEEVIVERLDESFYADEMVSDHNGTVAMLPEEQPVEDNKTKTPIEIDSDVEVDTAVTEENTALFSQSEAGDEQDTVHPGAQFMEDEKKDSDESMDLIPDNIGTNYPDRSCHPGAHLQSKLPSSPGGHHNYPLGEAPKTPIPDFSILSVDEMDEPNSGKENFAEYSHRPPSSPGPNQLSPPHLKGYSPSKGSSPRNPYSSPKGMSLGRLAPKGESTTDEI